MRKMPVLSLAGLAAVVGLVAAPAQAETVFGTETPDVQLEVGTQADGTFDLNDFFSTTEGDLSYSAGEGAELDGSSATVFGSDAAGTSTVEFTASVNGEEVTVDSLVQVSTFLIGNGPAIDNNNRWAGVEAGNIFVNALTAGEEVDSAVNLSGIPALGDGNGTPGGVTGAALIATLGSVELSYAATGQKIRTSTLEAEGADGVVSGGGLTATLNEDGSYNLTAGDDFAGDWIVTLGAQQGDSASVVHMLAAASVEADVTNAGSFIPLPVGSGQAALEFGANGITVTAEPGQGVNIVHSTAVPVAGEYVTISADVETSSTAAAIAVIGFDAEQIADPALGQKVFYTNPTGANLEADAVKNIAVSAKPLSGNVIPAVQVFNGGDAAITVVISKLEAIMAGPLTNYALNVNATAPLGGEIIPGFNHATDGSVASADGWLAFTLVGDTAPVAPTLSDDDNFDTATSAGSLMLAGSTGVEISQAFTTVALGQGTAVAECFAKAAGSNEQGETFILNLTDGGANNFAAFVDGATLPSDSWTKVTTSSTLSAASSLFVVAQAAGQDVLVDDFKVRVIADSDAHFDATLAGL